MNRRWSVQEAWDWYGSQPWFIGFNYVPSNAVNSCEMWNRETFSPEVVAQELELARSTGYNACRVFLPYIVWKHDREGFLERFRHFLEIAASKGIRTLPILFDDCNFADLQPTYGPQPDPVPGVHNSRWVASPGDRLALDKNEWPRLACYVKDIVTRFGHDERIIAWDLYNEPENSGMEGKSEPLLRGAYGWARECRPQQPLTSGIYSDKEIACDRASLELSDIISFHLYADLDRTRALVEKLEPLGRPIFCTEWLHRPRGSCFESHLPFFRKKKIGSFHWGLVCGKTQTHLSWSTMGGNPDASPALWQHDVFHPDGVPYRESEIQTIKAQANQRTLYLHPVPMEPKIMNYLEERKRLIRLTPGAFPSDTGPGRTEGKTVYASDPKFGSHMLISVSVNMEHLGNFGTHSDNEEFLLIGRPESKPLYLAIALCDRAELDEGLLQGTVRDCDMVTLKVEYNNPECSFFTMLKDVPHGEMVFGEGEPATFFVTEPSGMTLERTDWQGYELSYLI